jgi:hypothetical protein
MGSTLGPFGSPWRPQSSPFLVLAQSLDAVSLGSLHRSGSMRAVGADGHASVRWNAGVGSIRAGLVAGQIVGKLARCRATCMHPAQPSELSDSRCSPMCLPLVFAAVGLLSAGIPVVARAESMLDQIVINRCSAAMQADFDKAGKTPPAGLIQQTCNCVAQQLNQTHNLDSARAICTQQAQSGM